MKYLLRLLWLLVISGGVALCCWYIHGPPSTCGGSLLTHDAVRFGPVPIVLTWAWILCLIGAILASRRSTSPKGTKCRFQYSLRSLLAVLTLSALAMGLGKWWLQEPPPLYRTLPEILAAHDGFDFVQGPDEPGPYQYLGTVCAARNTTVSGEFRANGKTRSFHVPGVPGEEFRVVGLAPQDGSSPTYIVLKAHPH
jgi:hypothetical protein